MRRYLQWVLGHRAVVIGVCVVLTGLSAVSLSRVRMSTSLSRMFLGDTPDHRRYVERLERYGGTEQLMVGFDCPDLGDPAFASTLRRIVGDLENTPGVSRVVSLFDVIGEAEAIDVDRLVADPVASGMLVSADGRHMTVVVEFEPDSLSTLEQAPATVERITDVFSAAGIERPRLHTGGFIAMLAETNRQGRRNLLWITPLVAVVLLSLIFVFFRRLWPVALTAVVAFLAIVWSMGFASVLSRELNVLIAMAPAMILIISFSDVVHLCSAYIKELAGGTPRDAAILASAGDVGRACIFTSLTTFVGFISISFIPVPAFRLMGLIMGFGTAVALVLAMTLVPVVFSFMRPPEPWTHRDERRSASLLDGLLAACERWATHRPWVAIGGAVVVTAVLVVGCLRIRIDADFIERMAPRNPLRVDAAYFNDHFAGTVPLELFITFDELSLPRLVRVVDFHRALEARDDIAKVLPPLGMTAPANLATELPRFVDLERREIRLIGLLSDSGVSEVYAIGESVRAQAEDMLGAGMSIEPSGFFYMAGRWLDRHIISQKRAVFTAFVTIAIMLVVLFRSFTVGLWSMLPNILPLLAVGGVLGYGWATTDSDMIIMLVVAIGLAVDDTIHFLSRWRLELRRGAGCDEAVHRAFTYAGRAIVQTSLIFAIGFAPMVFSDYLPLRLIGVLMPVAVLTALVADVVVLPAMIKVGVIRGVLPVSDSDSDSDSGKEGTTPA